MGGMRISELDFVRLLPAFMRDDEAVIALSKAVSTLMGEPGKRLDTLRTWDKIDELTEEECDELAWELDVDWYDSTGMGLDEKQETLKLAQQIKRKRGTKWAVERLIAAYLRDGYLMEWYEMDKAPYTFMVLTTNPKITGADYNKFVTAVNAAKSERSHIVGIFFFWQQEVGIECALGAEPYHYDFRPCGTYDSPATVGFIVEGGIETEPEEIPYLYSFTATGEDAICGTYPRTLTVGTLIETGAAVEMATASTVYAFTECGTQTCISKDDGNNTATLGRAVLGKAILGRK